MQRKLIHGCVDPTPLLVRYTLLRTPWGQLRLHHFLRSDEDRELHDHPWAFLTFILWRGYVEEIPQQPWRNHIVKYKDSQYTAPPTEKHRRWPLQILYRPAHWAHRVDVAPGTTAWTLIWMFPKVREWGFFTKRGWVRHQAYHLTAACDEQK